MGYWIWFNLLCIAMIYIYILKSCKRSCKRSCFRYYIIHAHQSQKHDKVVEFFERFGRDILGNGNRESWREWFCFPYVKMPEQHPVFAPYLQWVRSVFSQNLIRIITSIFMYNLYISLVVYLRSVSGLCTVTHRHQLFFSVAIVHVMFIIWCESYFDKILIFRQMN